MRSLWKVPALGAFFVALAVVLAACGGNSVPGNAVAKVGGDTISKEQFDHWLKVAAISSTQGDPSKPKGTTVVPVPPDFTACVAQKKASAPTPAKGQPAPTEAQFRAQCKQTYEALKAQVLQFLISAQWIKGEAKDQGISVSDQEVTKQFQQTKKQSFPKDKDFQQFLRNSGMTLDDIMFRVRLDVLSNKLRQKITKSAGNVTAADIQRYFEKNKARFAQPERRDLRIVLTKTRARALEAKRALESGQSFKVVAKRYSIDQASKNQGGVLLAVAKGQQEKALDQAIFSAPVGKLQGPVKTQFGYYVFKVGKITPATQQSIKDATPTIRQLLTSQNQQKSLDAFVKRFQKKWKDKTTCRSGFVVQDCQNAPKPTTTTAPAPGQPGQTTTTG